MGDYRALEFKGMPIPQQAKRVKVGDQRTTPHLPS